MTVFGFLKRRNEEGDEEIVVDQNRKAVANAYRTTFTSTDGPKTLDDLLNTLYFYDTAENDEQRIRQNVAREILNKLGIFNTFKTGEVTNSLLLVRTELEES